MNENEVKDTLTPVENVDANLPKDNNWGTTILMLGGSAILGIIVWNKAFKPLGRWIKKKVAEKKGEKVEVEVVDDDLRV